MMAVSRIACAAGLVAFITPASAESNTAALDIRVVIPKMLRVLENSYPASLRATDQAARSLEAHQRLVVVSTLAKGFCIDLQTSRQLTDWRLSLSGSSGTWLQQSDTGYRLCTARPGRYDVALRHDFDLPNGHSVVNGDAIAWPVTVNWTAP